MFQIINIKPVLNLGCIIYLEIGAYNLGFHVIYLLPASFLLNPSSTSCSISLELQ